MKTCFKCQKEKPVTDFYKHPQMADGLLGKCKECTKSDSHRRHNEKLMEPEWAIKERKRQREKEEKRRVLGLVKPITNRRQPNRRKANVMMANAVRDGRLTRIPCEVCGNQRSQGHHEDYSKPLDVVWLCTRHHADRHIHLRDRKTLQQDPMPIAEFIEALKQPETT
jgi:hypothetical protein